MMAILSNPMALFRCTARKLGAALWVAVVAPSVQAQTASPVIAYQPVTGYFTEELTAIAKDLIGRHFPGLPLPRLRMETSAEAFRQGLGAEPDRAYAYWNCQERLIALNPAYQFTYGFSQLVDTLKHELIHAWVSWRQGQCGLDVATGGHNETFLRKAIEMKLDLRGTLEAFPQAERIHAALTNALRVPTFSTNATTVPDFGRPAAFSALQVQLWTLFGAVASDTAWDIHFNTVAEWRISLRNDSDQELFIKGRLQQPNGFCMPGNCALHGAFISRQSGRCLPKSSCDVRLHIGARTGAWTALRTVDGRTFLVSQGTRDPSVDIIPLDRRFNRLIVFVEHNNTDTVELNWPASMVPVNLGFRVSLNP